MELLKRSLSPALKSKSFVLGCLISISFIISDKAYSQCGLLSGNTIETFSTSGVCAGVVVSWDIQYGFIAPVNPSQVFFRFEWNDPSNTIYDVQANCTGTNCVPSTGTQIFNYPGSVSNCEYFPSVTLAYDANGNGLIETSELCSSSIISKSIASWDTDDSGSASLSLSPSNVEQCVDEPLLSFQFQDASIPNCSGLSLSNPNQITRWVQFVYGSTNQAGPYIPNVSVDTGGGTVQITDVNGNIINTFYGPVIEIPLFVSASDLDELSYPISFSGDNSIGDILEVTLRNWNFCNTYDSMQFDGNPPLDPINGDNPPVTTSSKIEIIGPTVANAGPDQNVCGTSTFLEGNPALVGTGNWTQITGATVLNFNDNSENTGISIANSSAYGTYLIEWAINLGSCISRDTVSITFNDNPTDPLTGPDQNVCGLTTNLMANNPIVGSGTWVQISGATGLTISNPLDPQSQITVSSYGDYTLEWQTSNANCPIKRDEIDISFFEDPSVANAGSDQDVCGTITSMNATALAVGIGQWSVISSPVGSNYSFGNISGENSTFSVDSFGTYSLEWEASNGNCTKNYDTVDITFFPPPSTPDAGPDQIVCGLNTTLNANDPEIGTGEWFLVSGPSGALISNALDQSATFSSTSYGTYVWEWRVTSPNCPPVGDQVSITFQEAPVKPNAGVDQDLCGTVTTLNAGTPIVGTGSWSIASSVPGSNPFFGNVSDPASTFQSDSFGVYQLEWIASNGTCPVNSDTVEIVFNEAPLSTSAGPDQSVCGLNATLNAYAPENGIGVWTKIAGPGGAVTFAPNANDPNAMVTVPIASPIRYVFRWTIFNSNCPPVSDDVEITFYEAPQVVDAGIDQDICGLSTSLNASFVPVGTGTWTVANSPIGSNPGFTNANMATTLFQSDSFGTYQLVWTASNGPCAETRDTVEIVLNSNPDLPAAGLDQQVCGLSTTLDANIPTVGTGYWTQIGGPTLITFNDSTNAKTTLSSSSFGSFTLEWRISNANCPEIGDQVVVEFFDNPSTADAGPDQNICASSTILGANLLNIGSGLWSVLSSPTGSNPNIANPDLRNSTFNTDSFGTYQLLWTASNGTCPVNSDTVEIILNQNPSIAVCGPDKDVCGLSSTLLANAPVVGNGQWVQVAGPSGLSISDNTDPLSSITAVNYGSYTLEWRISNANCPIQSDQIQITFLQNPTAPNAGLDDLVCGTSYTLNANSINVGIGNWTFVSTPGGANPILSNISGNNSVLSVDSFGVYILQWNSQNSCSSDSDRVKISFVPEPTFQISSQTDTRCAGNCDGTAHVNALTGTAPFYYEWDGPSDYSGSSLTNLCAGTYQITMTDKNGCIANGSISIDEADSILTNYSVANASCEGFDGSINLTAVGGTGNLTYRWNTGRTTEDIDSLPAGLYLVRIRDQNNCEESVSVAVNNSGGPTLSINNITPVTCFGESNGGVDVQNNGPNTTYLWSNGANTQDIVNLATGPYELMAADTTDNCVSFLQVYIPEPDKLEVDLSVQNATCMVPDGSASVIVSGGNGNNTINWSTSTTGSSVSGLSSGIYNVTVSDFKGCSITKNFAVSDDGAPIIFEDSVLDVTCGNNDGGIYISTTGNSGDFTYLWSNGDTTQDLTNLSSGSYELEVTDTIGCKAYYTTDVNQIVGYIPEICMVRVDSINPTSHINQIIWTKFPGKGDFSHFNVYRESTVAGLYQLIGNVDADSIGSYNDSTSNPFLRSYRYKISVVDSCGVESDLSDLHKTIHLVQTFGIAPNTINLLWDDYEGFPYSTYYIYRNTAAQGWELIDSVASNLNSYTESIPTLINDPELLYAIKVVTPGNCDPTKDPDYTRTRSNPSSTIWNPEQPGSIEEEWIKEIKIHPNPSSDVIYIKGLKSVKNPEYRLFDINGVMLQNSTYIPGNGIKIENLPEGIYLIKINGQKLHWISRFIKK